jgi:hypothetical protein
MEKLALFYRNLSLSGLYSLTAVGGCSSTVVSQTVLVYVFPLLLRVKVPALEQLKALPEHTHQVPFYTASTYYSSCRPSVGSFTSLLAHLLPIRVSRTD